MVVAVIMEGLSREELYQIGCNVEVDVRVLHVRPWRMDGIPDLLGIESPTGEKVFLEPGVRIKGNWRWTGEVEPMIGERVSGKAGGVGEDHADCDWVARKIRVPQSKRQIKVDVVIQLKEPLLMELHECGAGDCLGDGCDDIDGLGGRWNMCIDVSIAVCVLPEDCCIVDDTGRHTWVVADGKQ